MLHSKNIVIYAITYILIGIEVKAQVPTANWDDYLEIFSSMRYCKDMVEVKEDYKECVQDLVNPSMLRIQGDIFVQLCSSPQGYLNCWKPVVEKSRACNAGTEYGVPSVYKATFEAMCGKDRGRSNRAKLDKAAKLHSPQCIAASGDHWVDACGRYEIDMSSNDSCTRYRALSKCLNLIVCKNKPIEKFYLDLYKEAGQILGC